MTRSRWPSRVLPVLLASILLVMVTPAGSAAVIGKGPAAADALDAANAMTPSSTLVTSAAWHHYAGTAADPSAAVSTSAITSTFGVPEGSTFTILSTGDATEVLGAQSDGRSTSFSSTVHGGNDVTVLEIGLDTGSHNCLSFEFQFLSEEFPEYVGSSFNDLFVAELDTHSWSISGSTLTAPDNFAFEPVTSDPIGVNHATMTAAAAAGSAMDGGTSLMIARTPIGAGSTHTLYLSITDAGDHILDSVVFLDNLKATTVADPANDCAPGARPLPDFTWTPRPPCDRESVMFVDTSTPSGSTTFVSSTWDFGDGAPSPDYSGPYVSSISHTFASPGTYPVTLTVTASDGRTYTTTKAVTVDDCRPTVDFSWKPDPACILTTTTFTDHSAARAPWTLVGSTWDFGDPPTSPDYSGAWVSTIDHMFLLPGTYSVTLTVEDSAGRTASITKPVTVATLCPPPPPGAAAVSAGADHTCVLIQNGSVECYGRNSHGQDADRFTEDVTALSAGAYHNCVVLDVGDVDCWGSMTIPRTSGMAEDVASGLDFSCQLLTTGNAECWGTFTVPPSVLVGYGGTDAVNVTAGWEHACVLTDTAMVHCWGENDAGQLMVPPWIQGSVIQIDAGDHHTCALLVDQSVECWGLDNYGQSAPYPPGMDVVEVSAGGIDGIGHTCVRFGTGDVECWGSNGFNEADPYMGGDAVALSAGGWHNCVVRDVFDVRCWGANMHLQSEPWP